MIADKIAFGITAILVLISLIILINVIRKEIDGDDDK